MNMLCRCHASSFCFGIDWFQNVVHMSLRQFKSKQEIGELLKW